MSISKFVLLKNKKVNLTEKIKKEQTRQFTDLAGEGFRVIGFSYKEENNGKIEKDQIFLGMVAIVDPLRTSVPKAVKQAYAAGIKVIMITGDNPLTASSIGKEAGISSSPREVMIGSQLNDLTDEQLSSLLDKIKIFARTTPEHKLRIIKLLQKKGEVVTVTGDGVNDAPALKQADVGVAMGITGTDVTKETAAIVITDDNFATIIDAIEQGRNIFDNIKNAIIYLLACNLGEVIYILLAVIFNWTILTPLQLLYINLATDGLPAIALAFAPQNQDIMKMAPRRSLQILNRFDYRYILKMGLLTAFFSYLAIFSVGLRYQPIIVVTVLFTAIIVIQQLILVDLWLSQKPILKNLALLKKPIFLAGFLFPFILHPFIIYTPFLQQIFKVTSLSIIPLTVTLVATGLILIPMEINKKSV